MTHSITLELPERIYRSLADNASRNGKEIEEVAIEKLADGYPAFGDDPLDQLIGTLETEIRNWGPNHDKHLGEAIFRDIRGEV